MIKINWYEEDLDKIYGDDNEGYIYGIETKYDCHWFKTEQRRDKEYNNMMKERLVV